jgi:hypothetical protein
MRRTLRTVVLVVAVAIGVVLATTWYGRLVRCQAELAAWAQIRAAIIQRYPPTFLLEEQRTDTELMSYLDAFGVLRTEATVRHYCDAPVWEWWR